MNKIWTTLLVLFCASALFAQEPDSKARTFTIEMPDTQLSFGVYGVVDGGVRYADRGIAPGSTPRTAFDSSIGRPSRLGFASEANFEDLLKAGIVLERGFSSDNGSDLGGWARQALVYFAKDGYGKLVFGRQQLPIFYQAIIFDPLRAHADAGMLSLNYKYTPRVDNLMAYESPAWKGLSFKTGYTFNYNNNETSGNDNDIPMAFFAPHYKNGKLEAALNLQYFRAASTTNPVRDGAEVTEGDAFALYNFGPFSLHGGAGFRHASQDDFVMFPGEGSDTFQFFTGVRVPVVKKVEFLSVYSRRVTESFTGGDDAITNEYATGFCYTPNKNLQFYLVYSDIINNAAAKNSYLNGGRLASHIPGDGGATAGGYQSSLTLSATYIFDFKVKIK